jgi:hypothetical protein
MDNAEKKWEEWIKERVYDSPYEINLANETREAYKQALREAIEKRIEELGVHMDNCMASGDEENAVRMSAKMAELMMTLSLLDTVTPK